MKKRTSPGRVFVLLLTLLLPALSISTPFIPMDELQRQFQRRQADFCPDYRLSQQSATVELDELDEYPYTLHAVDILDWLTILQVSTTGENYGGMREGEGQDWNIIQTDNTQEALRDWAHFAILSGDLDRYSDNIEAAWEYVMNWPAYSEEGGGNPNYYRVHNCGWGLVATMEYTTAYSDTTFLVYGDSCAAYLDTYRLDLEAGAINPLSAGFGAGSLYLYGIWRDNQDWVEAAQEIADEIKLWIEADPDRLNSHETWAMSGGTAMWGVVTALFIDDPVTGAEWLPGYTPFMDTYSGPGNWNNSWTIWYGHAWHVIHRVLLDQNSYDNALEVVEYMLAQGGLDDDSGIPGTEDLFNRDQSWTSAYTVWYGLEPIIEEHTPDYDATPVRVVTPVCQFPLQENLPVIFVAEAANAGLLTLDNITLNISNDGYTGTGNISLGFAEKDTVTLTPEWTPDSPGLYSFDLVIDCPEDTNPDNDTLYVTCQVIEASTINGEIVDEGNGEGIHSRIEFFNLDLNPDSVYYTVLNNPVSGAFGLEVIIGTYRLEVTPIIPPYTSRVVDSVIVDENGADEVNLSLSPATVMIVADDTSGYESWFIESLTSLGIDAYPWPAYQRGQPEDTIMTVPCVIWSTGDLQDDMFQTYNWNDINQFLESGGSMLLTGQDLQNKWGGFTILRSRFGVDSGELDLDMTNIQNRILRSTPEMIISHGDSTTIFSPFGQGATNQDSPDELIPINGAETIFRYGVNDFSAAVAFDNQADGYRTVCCGFGVEGIPGNPPGFISRTEFLRRTLEWFEIIEDAVQYEPSPLSSNFALHTWPNPFNPTLNIQLNLEIPGEINVILYDLLGRCVVRRTPGMLQPGQHRFSLSGTGIASGVYFLELNSPWGNQIRKVVLVR